MNHLDKKQRTYYGHSVQGDADTSRWELLSDHIQRVSDRCAAFAKSFQAENWGRLAGLWHDLGKYSDAFQDYLLTANGFEAHLEQFNRVDHSTAGAQLAAKQLGGNGQILAYVIAGHHAGLANASGGDSSLFERQRKKVPACVAVPDEILRPECDLEPLEMQASKDTRDILGFRYAFFTRMLFSCLVDADFLATEEFCDREKSERRASGHLPPFMTMQAALDAELEKKQFNAVPGTVSTCRQQILAACRDAAAKPPGMFSLTVPTGGGKTLSSLAFALEHAIQRGKSRIVYAIPFTSIIEQTADVFRQVFQSLSDEIVLEHHSNVDPEDQRESPRSRLATENWDAPLVVTTNVQLFESLFAAKTSRCRKLHNLVNSVIILDEAQTLPVDRLRPCLAALQELVRGYGCTIVLCTATQPAVHYRDQFTIGLPDVMEIIPEPAKLAAQMKRVQVRVIGEPCSRENKIVPGKITDQELVTRMEEQASFLTIVNTRAHAAKLFRELESSGNAEGLYHLSTLMCGQHRSDTIVQIRRRLQRRQTCRVISTQLIEAGVDVDFPVVFRALSGLDSIAQAAGRCNREGRSEIGTVFVFDPQEVTLQGYLRSTAMSASEIIPAFQEDVLSPDAIRAYFELHYWKRSGPNRWDKTPEAGVMKCFPCPTTEFSADFRNAADRFRLIEEQGQTVFVPYGCVGRDLIRRLRLDGPDRKLLRQLQRYSVTLYNNLYQAMAPDIEPIHGQYPALINGSAYDEKLGIRIDRPGYVEPSALIM
ncbi:CRISPR-associated helicase Cas3' [Schlesneria sp. DSM 10557]|uniref:CRISPR-associated helicase Cas3' n=1 Tax=Schlesneria sp. DSM 10557 TaxID=3044399 RepID=UPI00359FC10B